MSSRRRLIVRVQQRGGQYRDPMVIKWVETVVSHMMSTRLANTLRITVKLRANTGAKDRLGHCEWRDHSRGKSSRSNHHTIVVQRDLPVRELLGVIVHELQHVKQMITGRLKLRMRAGRLVFLWRNIGHRGRADVWETDSHYYSRPWEIEARQAEEAWSRVIQAATV